jgi:hypothetical protein
MSKQDFDAAISKNERESRPKKGGTHVLTSQSIIFPPHLLNPENTDFNLEKLTKSLKGRKGEDTGWIMKGSGSLKDANGMHFLWTISPKVKGQRTGLNQSTAVKAASQGIIYSSRTFIREHLKEEFKKAHPYSGGKHKAGQDPERYVGGHVEASAFIQVLRKAQEFGFPPERIAALRVAYQSGGLEKVDNLLLSWSGGFGIPGEHGGEKQGFVESWESDFGLTYEQISNITGEDLSQNMYHETMIPITHKANKEQADGFEKIALGQLQSFLRFWSEWLSKGKSTSSPDLFSMVGEIIAAKLLGQKAPKYKGKIKKSKGRAKVKVKTKPFTSGRKRKGDSGKVAVAKMKAHLRTTKGKFASPVALMNILNKKLPATIRDNMGHPALQNVSGRFAGSIRVQKVNPALGRSKPATIQYSYDTDPYQVFETGGKGDSRWATTARDPRILIDKSIREIAAESMMTRFVTQRL